MIHRAFVAAALSAVVAGSTLPALAESDHALGVSAGLGLSFADTQNGQHVDGTGMGGFAEAEYIYRWSSWLTPRAYGGLLLTSPETNCGTGIVPCDVSAKVVFLGGKLRLLAPIPYVAPFLEVGLGVSAGSMSTRSGRAVDAAGSGLMYHVPLTLGLAIGPHHELELSFQYLYHPEQKQVGGAAAIGLVFGLG